jgi:hypothetical protein
MEAERDLAGDWGGGLAGFENNFLSDSNMDRLAHIARI